MDANKRLHQRDDTGFSMEIVNIHGNDLSALTGY